jgi:FkbM family methyltransferase
VHLQTTASRAVTLLAKNPSLFCRLALAKLGTKRPMPRLPACRQIGNVIFECSLPNYHGTAPMYFGSYAVLVVEAMRRFLRPGDIFLDVGANIGYLSAIGADLVGRRGQVHSFEPVPAYFEKLCRLVDLNPGYNITANPFAAGEASSACTIYVTRQPGQSTLVPSYKASSEIVGELEVPVVRLDAYIERHKLGRIALIKIDAEGFELPILKGLQGYWEATGESPAIICEIAPRAYSLMGRNIDELAELVAAHGYTAHDLIDCSTPVDLGRIDHVEDVLFVAGA